MGFRNRICCPRLPRTVRCFLHTNGMARVSWCEHSSTCNLLLPDHWCHVTVLVHLNDHEECRYCSWSNGGRSETTVHGATSTFGSLERCETRLRHVYCHLHQSFLARDDSSWTSRDSLSDRYGSILWSRSCVWTSQR